MPTPVFSEIAEIYVPQAKWIDDCQGKKDFDCALLSISTRYWPERYQQNGMCSAECTIGLNFDLDIVPLITKEFEAHSENVVKTLVEVWVTDESRRLLTELLKLGYGVPKKE